MVKTLVLFLVSFVMSALSVSVYADRVEQSARYTSLMDQNLSLNVVTIIPTRDNVEKIYSSAIDQHLRDLIQQSHRFDLSEKTALIEGIHPDELEESPDRVKALKDQLGGDGAISCGLIKGPNGISIKLDLFLFYNGELFAQEILKNHPRFEIKEINDQITKMYYKLIQRIPYDGILLSRRGTRVTLNMGTRNGLKSGDIVSAIQILNVERHPKFRFLVASEKEFLGRVKIVKTEESLSFGIILSELEKGALQQNTKLIGAKTVNYADSDSSTEFDEATEHHSFDNKTTTTSADPTEWIPKKPPTFGLVALTLGFGSYGGNLSLSSETLNTKSSFYPNIALNGELWLTTNWMARALIQQGIISVANPRASSSPSTLSLALNKYLFQLGYNFLMNDEFFGPKIILFFGYSTQSLFADNTTPTVLTSTEYYGYNMGLRGSFPFGINNKWELGAEFDLVMAPGVRETPVTSASSTHNTINEFSFFGSYKYYENLHIIGSLEFSLLTTGYSGSGTRTDSQSGLSSSQNYSHFNGGVRYLF